MAALLLGSISVVVDTSELQREAFNQAFAEHGLDWEWDRESYTAMLDSNGGRDRVASYAESRGEQVDADAVHATKSRIFQERLRAGGVEPRPGLLETVQAAREDGQKVVLVTTTSADNLAALDAALGDALSLADLDLVVDAAHVSAGKPDPAAYLYALEQLGEDAADCVAVEDNPGGVRAARAAGLRVAAFPNANTGGQDFGDAPRVEALDLATLRGMLPAA